MSHSVGVLLVNLGTPSDLLVPSIRKYLSEFLSDRRVIDLPLLFRLFLVRGIIVPFRAKKTLAAYKKIWGKDGSPLRLHSLALRDKLQATLGESVSVEVGMRYGTPSLKQALTNLSHCSKIIILPLYPQYASATTGSSIEYCLKYLAPKNNIPSLSIVNDFYQEPWLINLFATRIQKALEKKPGAHLVLSYHGLPERQIQKGGCQNICEPICTSNALTKNPFCYRGQCLKTSKLLAKALSLDTNSYTSCFQSRLGKLPWIKPYTDETLEKLLQQGIKNVVVACPSFSADCLETLEEIAIQAKENWHQKGGEDFSLVPSLNSDDDWVNALASRINDE